MADFFWFVFFFFHISALSGSWWGVKLHRPYSWVTVSLIVSILLFQLQQQFLGLPVKNCSAWLLLMDFLVELLFLRK